MEATEEMLKELEIENSEEFDINSEEELVSGAKKGKASSSRGKMYNFITFLKYVRVTSIFVLFGLFSSFLLNSFTLGDNYVDKKSIKSDLRALVNNGAGLRAVRFHYDHRSFVKRDILFLIKQDVALYYKYDVALSEVLEELRTQQFLEGSPDLEFLTKLNKIITEYTDSNPFDKLEPGQKDLFENIRVKLTTNYSEISSDVNKLSDELSNKNKLVNEYLSDSQTSLIVSIVSAFIAVILAGVQMWQNRYKTSRESPLSSRDTSNTSNIPDSNSEIKSINSKGERVTTTRYPSGKIRESTYHKDGSIFTKIKFV